MKIVLRIFLFIIALTIGCVISMYTFNEIDPWVGLIAYGLVAVLSIKFIINLIKNNF